MIRYIVAKRKLVIRHLVFSFLLIVLPLNIIAEEYKKDGKENSLLIQKNMSAVKTDTPPKIDGNLDEEVWMQANSADSFVQYSPYSGRASKYRTEVRILYDDNAIYIGAMMYDPYPDSIYKELGERDSDFSLNADFFSIDVCPYNDGINGASFKLSVSGVQSDRPPRSSTRRGGKGGMGGYGGGGDSWDAVWESKTAIVEDGWIAEIKIPYSALRFPNQSDQTWGINFWREVRRNREISSWNYVDREIGSTFNHLGELMHIRDIEPPLRLSLTPYVSSYLEGNSAEKGLGFSYNGGLDLKYGISEAFTLDATLVPDFGQVRSDDQVLNLSPYEVKYNENRPFFMEGTELFSKGDIFYSRRIGSTPQAFYEAYSEIEGEESVVYNPGEASLINASKLSGRTQSGLGIGVFNAMTNSMYAILEDSETDETREMMTDPFTNYNMIVLDQSLKNNSYLSVSNTNVWRDATNNEYFYNANVSATDFRIQNKSMQYSVSGQAALSQKYYKELDDDFGHAFQVRGGKTGGALRVEYELEASSNNYDPNDMGYLRRNNEFNNQFSVAYNILQPFWKILTMRNSFSYSYEMLYTPRVFTGSSMNLMSYTTFRNHYTFMVRAEYKPKGDDDYFEPRIEGWHYHRGKELSLSSWMSTDRSKNVSGNLRFSYNKIWSAYDQYEYSLSFGPDFKLSDRFSVDYEFEVRKKINDIGYVDSDEELEIISFGMRDNTTIENTFESSFIFSSESYLSLRLRHYWSRADYLNEYFTLQDDGSLTAAANSNNYDYNYNAWNIDMVYTWRFAPGSELSLVWKNSIYAGSDQIYYDFGDNIRHMFGSERSNSFSLKVLYYLDWLYLQKRP